MHTGIRHIHINAVLPAQSGLHNGVKVSKRVRLAVADEKRRQAGIGRVVKPAQGDGRCVECQSQQGRAVFEEEFGNGSVPCKRKQDLLF
jgi:hypothetical protein